jgi:hypothetical protein
LQTHARWQPDPEWQLPDGRTDIAHARSTTASAGHRLITMDMKSAVSRELRRRGDVAAALTSDDDSDDDSDSSSSGLEEDPETTALLRGAGASAASAARSHTAPRLQWAGALRSCGKWLQSSNNRSAACAVASAVSGVVFVCTGHPHLAVKCCVSFALLSIFCGLPQSDEDQAKEDKLLRQLHKSGM